MAQHDNDFDPAVGDMFAVFSEADPPRNWPPARRSTAQARPQAQLRVATAVAVVAFIGGALTLFFLSGRIDTQAIEAGGPTTVTVSSDGNEVAATPTTLLESLVGSVSDGFDVFEVPPTLAPRVGHSVTWTGTEVLVWGGGLGEGSGVVFNDGAQFDPTAGTWTPIDAGPLAGRSYAHTAWTGAELLVVGGLDAKGEPLSDGAAYDPTTDAWRELPAIKAMSQHSSSTWTGEALIVWDRSTDSVHALDPQGEWVRYPATGLGGAESLGALRWAGGRLIALSAGDNGLQLSKALTPGPGAEWQPLEAVDFATPGFVGDPFPTNAVVVDDRLIVWSRDGDASGSYILEPAALSWTTADPVPISACEGHIAPLGLGDQAALAADLCGGGSGGGAALALYSAEDESWRQLDLPEGGWPDFQYAVWTGHEVIAVAAACCDEFDLDSWQGWRLMPRK